MGIEADFDNPRASYSYVFAVYLSIQNPLYTSSIPKEVVNALEKESTTEKAQASYTQGVDPWDKRARTPEDWMNALYDDIEKGENLSWTSIPDWVTDVLENRGYDGIIDTGGKYGGIGHGVYIPFEPTQIKSAYGNKGTFKPKSSNILERLVRIALEE
jgi:hypothetical protein